MFKSIIQNRVFVLILLLMSGCLNIRINIVQAGTDRYGTIKNLSESPGTENGTNIGNPTYTGYTPVTVNYTPNYTPKVTRIKRRMASGTQIKLKVRGGKVTKWFSSNKKIAVVSKKGVVTAKSSGKVLIKAIAQGKAFICELTVYKNELKQKLSDQDLGCLQFGNLEYGVTSMDFDKNGNFNVSMCLYNRTKSTYYEIYYIKRLAINDKGNKTFIDVNVTFNDPIVIHAGEKQRVNIYVKRKNVDRVVDLTKIEYTYSYYLDIDLKES